MRQLKLLPIFIFILFQGLALFFTKALSLENLYGSILVFLLINVVFYRTFIFFFPLREGDIPVDSKQEMTWMIYTCFWLTYFHPLRNLNIVPVYLTPFTNRLLGGKMNLKSFSAGVLFDPHFINIGEGSFVGNGAMLIPHYHEGIKLGHRKIDIGKNVTIGARSVILSGVVIEDNAIVGAMSLVPKNTIIKSGEVWVGVPARKIK